MDGQKLTRDQRKAIQMLLYAREKESQLSILANALNEPMYSEENAYLEKKASLYDFVFWETLGKLTGETVNSLLELTSEASKEVEARALYYSKLTKEERFNEVERSSEE